MALPSAVILKEPSRIDPSRWHESENRRIAAESTSMLLIESRPKRHSSMMRWNGHQKTQGGTPADRMDSSSGS